MSFVLQKLCNASIWKRIWLERLTEPLHLNLISVFVALFGTFRAKVAFDLVVRQHNAYGLLRAALSARYENLDRVTVIEFGVASGAGLLNLCRIAKRVTKATGVTFRIVGFDSGLGMPPPVDYRDHPNMYIAQDFPMELEALRAALPSNAELIIGPIAETIGPFLTTVQLAEPLGYVVLDVDYYSSAVDCLKVFDGQAGQYLHNVLLYADDVTFIDHNKWQGELLALHQFNEQHVSRKISRLDQLKLHRTFRNARWLTQMFYVHIFDSAGHVRPRVGDKVVLDNPYL